MTVSQIIDQIVALPPAERAEVIRFARRMDEARVSGDELAVLAERLADSHDSSETLSLREEIVRGFYGKKPDA